MAFRVGDTIGDYRIEALLGEGGMGQVFRVRNLLSDRVEAMKIVLPQLDGSQSLPERFLREIRILASLDHPHIVAMRTALRVDDRVALVMELVDGVSLYSKLRSEGLALGNALRYVGQVLGALGYAHSRGVVHRDIKPDNILVTHAGAAKLTDFGVAFLSGDRGLTSTGAAVGSLHYMSPEQVRGGEVDGRSDLYSVGITLYELTTGKRAIQGDSSWSIMNGHLNQQPTPPADLNPTLPRDLSDVILRSIAKTPGERFQTADEFRSALGVDAVTITRLPGFMTPSLAATPAPSPVPPTATPTVAMTSAQPFTFDAGLLRTVKQKLAAFQGPIANIMVDRAARTARSPRELYEALAAQIPQESERQAFLRALPR